MFIGVAPTSVHLIGSCLIKAQFNLIDRSQVFYWCVKSTFFAVMGVSSFMSHEIFFFLFGND